MEIGQAFLVALACLGIAYAQPPQFEVASVKPSTPPAGGRNTPPVVRGGPGSTDPALARFDNVDLDSLITMSYGIARFQLSGPDWMKTARFDINARVPLGTTIDQYRLMLQNLLAERFKLTLHHETKEMVTYQLVVAKGGPKLKEVEADTVTPSAGLIPPPNPPPVPNYNGAVTMNGIKRTMEGFAALLTAQLGGPVTDATGLKGTCLIALHWSGTGMVVSASDEPDPHAVEGQPTLLQALQEQLGLKLEPKKGPVDVLVIDHVERSPIEN
jgi:uncharacterized protein (TIGR03435 family)